MVHPRGPGRHINGAQSGAALLVFDKYVCT